MYRVGEEAFGPRKCWRPDWESLIPPNPAVPAEQTSLRFLGAYPDDMADGSHHRPIHDLRRILWCFDRINEASKRESSLDEQLLVSLMGHATAWYRLLCGRLEPKQGAQLYSLVQLAAWMEDRGWREDPRNAHWKIPENDFPNREDEVPVAQLPSAAKARSRKNQQGSAPAHKARATTPVGSK